MRRFEVISASLLVPLGLWCALQQSDLCWFNTHMARDWCRAVEWAQGRPAGLGGPELNYGGGQLFGPGFYLYLAALWKLTGSLAGMAAGGHALTCVLLLAFCATLRRDLGATCAWVFFLAFFLMPVQVAVGRTLWNPALILPINLALLLTARAAVLAPRCAKRRLAYCLVGWLGIQVHLAVLPAFLSGWSLLLRKGERRGLLLGLAALAGWALVFKLLRLEGGAYLSSLGGQYRLPPFGLAWPAGFLARWPFHLHLCERPLGDYELFPLLFRFMDQLLPQRYLWLEAFQALWPIPAAVLVLALFERGREEHELADFYRSWTRLWLLLSALGLYFYTAKGGVIPYRYGLMVYPAHFLLAALWARRRSPSARTAALVFSALLFVGNALALLSLYEVMARCGRASHVTADSLELPLRYKLQLVRRAGAEPWRQLHGPIANKIRNKEHDWFYTSYYGAVERSLGPPGPSLGPCLVQSVSLAEMDGRNPFLLMPLGEKDLPQSVEVNGRALDPHCILPLQGQPHSQLRVSAQLAASDQGYLRVCYDDSPAGRILILRALTLNGQACPYKPECTGWLAQSVVTLALPPGEVDLELEFEVRMPWARYTRLDIFKTPGARSFSPLGR